MRVPYILAVIAVGVVLVTTARSAESFHLDSTVLYQPNESLESRLASVDELAAHIKRLLDVSTVFFASEKTPERLDIVVGLKAGKKVKVWFVSSRRDSKDESLVALGKQLESVPPCEVRGSIAFALRCSIAGGGATKSEGEIPTPKEWREAGESVLIPDGIFERIWRE